MDGCEKILRESAESFDYNSVVGCEGDRRLLFGVHVGVYHDL